MVRRSAAYDPLEPTTQPRWYVVRTQYGSLLESAQLPATADLKREFVAAMLRWIDEGWKLSEFSSRSGTFFCSRGTERHEISIQPSDPRRPPEPGPSRYWVSGHSES